MTHKPDDIPQYAWDAAFPLISGTGYEPTFVPTLISKAIIAEAERCALIADKEASERSGYEDDYSIGAVKAAERIAFAIRNPTP